MELARRAECDGGILGFDGWGEGVSWLLETSWVWLSAVLTVALDGVVLVVCLRFWLSWLFTSLPFLTSSLPTHSHFHTSLLPHLSRSTPPHIPTNRHPTRNRKAHHIPPPRLPCNPPSRPPTSDSIAILVPSTITSCSAVCIRSSSVSRVSSSLMSTSRVMIG